MGCTVGVLDAQGKAFSQHSGQERPYLLPGWCGGLGGLRWGVQRKSSVPSITVKGPQQCNRVWGGSVDLVSPGVGLPRGWSGPCAKEMWSFTKDQV